jgi:hypothetical protein
MLLACGTASFHFPDLFFTPIALFQVGFITCSGELLRGLWNLRSARDGATDSCMGRHPFRHDRSVDQLLGSTTMVFLGARTV